MEAMGTLPMQGGCNCPPAYYGPSLETTCGGGQFIVFMGLLDTFLRTQCDIADPCGRVGSPRTHDNEYDFIVVGGGSSGAVAASRLSEVANWKVLLLEAGMDEPTGTQVPSMVINYWGTELDWKYKTEPEPKACLGYPEKRCQWTRGKVLGGCSVLNGMMYLRGHPKDYDRWRDQGNVGWGWRDVLPIFMKSEDNRQIGTLVDRQFHGTGGPMPVQQFPHHPPLAEAILRAGQELGYPITNDLNGANHTGFAITQTNNERGSRMSTARAFLRPARNRQNLHVIVNATVTKVLINPTTKEATGVEFIRNGKKETARARKEVVLSAGAVNSPQLLLLSGVGPTDHLRRVGVPVIHDLPGVGMNLHNHVAFFISFIMHNHTAHQDLNWVSAMNYMLYRNGPLSSTGMSQVTAKVNSKFADRSGQDPDLQMFFGGYLANCAKSGLIDEPQDPEHPQHFRKTSFSPVVLHPKSRGHIKLRSANPLDDPLIYPNYLTDEADVKTLVEGCKLAVRLGQTRVLREEYGFRLDDTPIASCVKPGQAFNSDKYWECAVRHATGPENHQAGSCKMGPASDRMAVVSPELSVHGIKKLRVMDASIMPTVVSGNTNAPCMMIAEKGVDMIKKLWLQGQAGNADLGNRFGDSTTRKPSPHPDCQHPHVGHPHPGRPGGGGIQGPYPHPGQKGHFTHTHQYHHEHGPHPPPRPIPAGSAWTTARPRPNPNP